MSRGSRSRTGTSLPLPYPSTQPYGPATQDSKEAEIPISPPRRRQPPVCSTLPQDAAEPRSAPLAAPAARPEEEAEIAALPIPPWTTDDELVALWLHGKSQNTIPAYGEDVAAFRAFTGKGLRSTYLWDLQRYADALAGAPARRSRRLRAFKSLLSFAAKMGYLPFNVGAPIRDCQAGWRGGKDRGTIYVGRTYCRHRAREQGRPGRQASARRREPDHLAVQHRRQADGQPGAQTRPAHVLPASTQDAVERRRRDRRGGSA
jgi:hypothetical protein